MICCEFTTCQHDMNMNMNRALLYLKMFLCRACSAAGSEFLLPGSPCPGEGTVPGIGGELC